MINLERLWTAYSRRGLSFLLVLIMLAGLMPAYALESDEALKLTVENEGPYFVGENVSVHVAAPEGAAIFSPTETKSLQSNLLQLMGIALRLLRTKLASSS